MKGFTRLSYKRHHQQKCLLRLHKIKLCPFIFGETDDDDDDEFLYVSHPRGSSRILPQTSRALDQQIFLTVLKRTKTKKATAVRKLRSQKVFYEDYISLPETTTTAPNNLMITRRTPFNFRIPKKENQTVCIYDRCHQVSRRPNLVPDLIFRKRFLSDKASDNQVVIKKDIALRNLDVFYPIFHETEKEEYLPLKFSFSSSLGKETVRKRGKFLLLASNMRQAACKFFS